MLLLTLLWTNIINTQFRNGFIVRLFKWKWMIYGLLDQPTSIQAFQCQQWCKYVLVSGPLRLCKRIVRLAVKIGKIPAADSSLFAWPAVKLRCSFFDFPSPCPPFFRASAFQSALNRYQSENWHAVRLVSVCTSL